MRTLFSWKRIEIRAPTTGADWLCLFFVGSGIYQLIAGHPALAMDAFQLSLLLEILGRLPKQEA